MTKVITCHLIIAIALIIAQCVLFSMCSSLLQPHSSIQPLFGDTSPTSTRRSTTTSLLSANINAKILCRGNDDSNDDETTTSIPLILSIENLLTPSQLHDIRKQLGLHPSSSSSSPIDDKNHVPNLLTPTTDYQEDIHSITATQKEDEFFLSLISSTGLISSVPFDVTCDPLKGFVYIATHYGDVLTDDDIVRGANIIKRRQAMERWRSESGRLLMELSADNDDDDDDDDDDDRPFDNAARRFQLPGDLLTTLKNDIVTLVLSNETFIVSNNDDDDDDNNGMTAAFQQQHGRMTWTVRDATCVIYDEGQGQVPHFDPSDATLLLYIDDGDGRLAGGDTCFPLLLEDDGLRVPAGRRLGHGLLFFSSFFDRDKLLSSVERDRNVMLLHHGGRVRTGQKVIVQIMLDAEIDVSVCQNHVDIRDQRAFSDVSSWIDFVACPCQ